MTDKIFTAWFLSIMLFFVTLVALGTWSDRRAALCSATPQQLDSALVEAAYRLLSERDSVIRECVKKLGPLNPECRP